ncbi:hypothetical protein D3C71_1328980 [compost metagenome]
MHGGQRRGEVFCQGYVIEADNRDIFGQVHPPLAKGAHHAGGHYVVECQRGGKSLLTGEDFLCRCFAPLLIEGDADDPVTRHRNPGFGHRGSISLEALPAVIDRQICGDAGNVAVSALDEHSGGSLRRADVVQPDAAIGDGGQIAVDHHHRRSVGGITQNIGIAHAGDVGNNRFAALIDQEIQAVFLQFGLMATATDHQFYTVFARDIFHASGQSREKRIVEVTGQQPQHIAAAFRQRQRGGISMIVKLAHGFFNAFTGDGFNISGAVDHPADGGGGNASASGNVFHGGHIISCWFRGCRSGRSQAWMFFIIFLF